METTFNKLHFSFQDFDKIDIINVGVCVCENFNAKCEV